MMQISTSFCKNFGNFCIKFMLQINEICEFFMDDPPPKGGREPRAGAIRHCVKVYKDSRTVI